VSFKSPPLSSTTASSAVSLLNLHLFHLIHGHEQSTRHQFKSDSSDSGRGRRTSTPGTPPDTLWNTEQEALRLKEQQRKDEEALREARRLQALMEEEERSLQYARQLAIEDDRAIKDFEALKEANRSFECPICAEEYHEGFVIHVERCNHDVCRECVLNHVRTQVEEAHWPIFCPMCPGTLEKRGGAWP
jgi:Zinc finger, C3HC4 type (RING finger)